MRAALIACVALLGCATVRPGPSGDLLAARSAVQRARASVSQDRTGTLVLEAAQELARAEALERASPGDPAARDAAYVARRKAEKAEIADLHAAELEALETARGDVARYRGHLERRAGEAAAETRAMEAAEARRRRLRANRAAAVRLWARAYVNIDDENGVLSLSLPTWGFYDWGELSVRESSRPRVDMLVGAILSGPPCRILIRIREQQFSRTEDAATRAKQRAERVRDVFLARGLSLDRIETTSEVGPSGRVEIVVTEIPLTPQEFALVPAE